MCPYSFLPRYFTDECYMGEEGINFTGVAVLLNSFSESTGVQVRKDKGRYKK